MLYFVARFPISRFLSTSCFYCVLMTSTLRLTHYLGDVVKLLSFSMYVVRIIRIDLTLENGPESKGRIPFVSGNNAPLTDDPNAARGFEAKSKSRRFATWRPYTDTANDASHCC